MTTRNDPSAVARLDDPDAPSSPPLDAPDAAQREGHDSQVVARAVVRPERLRYHVLRPRAGEDRELANEAYRCWSEVWTETLRELDGRPSLPSDDFTRQDEILTLFHEDECVGLCFARYVDIESPIDVDDSYFSVWPAEAREAVRTEGSWICVPSHFTIAYPWRRARGCSLKDILLALSIEQFLDSDADALVGTMRNDRGMNAAAFRQGFRPVLRDVIHHGVPVDLVLFGRSSSSRRPTGQLEEEIVDTLRARRGARSKRS